MGFFFPPNLCMTSEKLLCAEREVIDSDANQYHSFMAVKCRQVHGNVQTAACLKAKPSIAKARDVIPTEKIRSPFYLTLVLDTGIIWRFGKIIDLIKVSSYFHPCILTGMMESYIALGWKGPSKVIFSNPPSVSRDTFN